MEKAKQYDWQDTNMALFGSDLEKKIKAAAAEDEPAWKEAGREVGIKIWRIEKFHVVAWPRKKYGKFHQGDSYIVLNTYKKSPDSEALDYDIHFWIGGESSQDEYGTAAYKTVELDHFLQDRAVQHRETQEHESALFLSYFKGAQRLQILAGGIESGFHHVEEEKVEPRLFQIKGAKNHIRLKEVKLRRDELNGGDVFVLDAGDNVWQWNGAEASVHEKRQAAAFVADLKAARNGRAETAVIEQSDEGKDGSNPEFWKLLPGEKRFLGIKVGQIKVKDASAGGDDDKVDAFVPQLWKLSDASGSLTFRRVVAAKSIERARLDSGDVFLLDTGFHVYVWVGKGASGAEKASGIPYAERYLAKHSRPPVLPITRVGDGREPGAFNEWFNDNPLPAGCCVVS